MSIDRIFNLVLNDLTSDVLKHQIELERCVNDNTLPIDEKLSTIKEHLTKITITEANIAKFSDMLKNQKEEKNGEV